MRLHNYRTALGEIEERLKVGGADTSLYDAFSGLDDDLYAFLLLKGFEGYPHIHAALPDWPPDSVRFGSVGNFTLNESVQETLCFYKRVREWQAQYGAIPFEEAKVLDYGCGWGRMLRMFAKSVAPDKLYGCDPDAGFMDYCKSLRVPGNMKLTDWGAWNKVFDVQFDLAYCFSVLTHTSEILHFNVLDRVAEMLKPGGLLIATIRPGALIEDPTGEMEHLSEEERQEWLRRYARGSFLYKPYRPEIPHWGVTVIPEEYLKAKWTRHFQILDIAHFYPNWTQVPVILRRK